MGNTDFRGLFLRSNRCGDSVLLPVQIRSGSKFASIIMLSNLVHLAPPHPGIHRQGWRLSLA